MKKRILVVFMLSILLVGKLDAFAPNEILNDWRKFGHGAGHKYMSIDWVERYINGKVGIGQLEDEGSTVGYWNQQAYYDKERNYNLKFSMYSDQYSSSKNGRAGYAFRMQRASKCYFLLSEGTDWIPSGLYKVDKPGPGFMYDERLMLERIPELDRHGDVDMDIEIRVHNDNIKVFVNNSLVCNYTDPDPIEYGGYGPFVQSQQNLYFYGAQVSGVTKVNDKVRVDLLEPSTNFNEYFSGDDIPVKFSLSDKEGDKVNVGVFINEYASSNTVFQSSEYEYTLQADTVYEKYINITLPKLDRGMYTLNLSAQEITNEGVRDAVIRKKYIVIKEVISPLKAVYETMLKINGTNDNKLIIVNIDKPIERNDKNDDYLLKIKQLCIKHDMYIYFINTGNINMDYIKENLTRYFIQQ